jgi:predicted ABC-type ATPase
MNNKYKLSKLAHDEIFDNILTEALQSSLSEQSPKIVILGGQPGSGKSSLFDFAKIEIFNNCNVVSINGDDYRMLHPYAHEIFSLDETKLADFTDPDVRVWTSRLLEECIKSRRNIILETTMRNREPLATTISKLNDIGYKVMLMIKVVHHQVSRINIVKRYETQRMKYKVSRWTPFEIHDQAYANLQKNSAFFSNSTPIDSITIFNRVDNILYSNATNSINFHERMNYKITNDPINYITYEQMRPFNSDDLTYISESIDYIQKAMYNRGAIEQFKSLSKILTLQHTTDEYNNHIDMLTDTFKP